MKLLKKAFPRLAFLLTMLLLWGCLAACVRLPLLSSPAVGVGESSLCGRWAEDQGRAELWIQEAEGEDLLFSLLIPGSAAINNALAVGEENGAFFYQDPYQEGVGASGSLRIENGIPVLYMGESRMAFPAGTVLCFSQRSGEEDYRSIYAPVLEAYQDFEREGGGLENWYGDEPGFVHSGLYGAEHFGYQFWDLNLDGSPELLLGVLYDAGETAEDQLGEGLYWHNLVSDLYTLVEGEPRYVVNSGDRYRYSLTTDGQLYYEGSSGAAYSDLATYELRDGVLQMSFGLCMDGSESECFTVEERFNMDREGYTPISRDEYYWLADHYHSLYKYDRFAPLQLTPVADWESR